VELKLYIEDLTFKYRWDDVYIFDSFNHVFEGPWLHVILGPNGVGKTTLLKLVAGVLNPLGGSISLEGGLLGRGDVSYVPQDNELLPWLSVYANVELPLRIAGVNGNERKHRVLEALKSMKVLGYANRYPKQLSGGERKRVALARALASDSKIVLLDEPTANLDPGSRELLWSYLKSLARSRLILVVTHNIGEALFEGSLIHILAGRPARVVEVFEGGEEAWSRLRRVMGYYKTS
jgi:NitT/TauT family transport system ATP-binding protein